MNELMVGNAELPLETSLDAYKASHNNEFLHKHGQRQDTVRRWEAAIAKCSDQVRAAMKRRRADGIEEADYCQCSKVCIT
jgi:hypothetical protein